MAVEVFWSSASSHGLNTSMRGFVFGSTCFGVIPYPEAPVPKSMAKICVYPLSSYNIAILNLNKNLTLV